MTSQTPQQRAGVPSPAYTRSDKAQPTVDEWADARLPATSATSATSAEAAAEHLITDAEPVLRGQQYMDEAQQNFGNDTARTYGRAVLVYRESMASPTVVDYREVAHIDSCRV